MKKKELIKIISEKTGLKKKFCGRVLDTITGCLKKINSEGRAVNIENFGQFKSLRKGPEIIANRSGIRTVLPPEDLILFECSENILSKTGEDCIVPDELISAVSIKNILSSEAAKTLTGKVFGSMRECFLKNKNIELQGLGVFKVKNKSRYGNNELKPVLFIPSKKFSGKINYRFNNLKAVDISVSSEMLKIPFTDNEEFNFRISDEFKNIFRDNRKESEPETVKNEEEFVKTESFDMKKLISDELIKLHKEITEASENKLNKNHGLWG